MIEIKDHEIIIGPHVIIRNMSQLCLTHFRNNECAIRRPMHIGSSMDEQEIVSSIGPLDKKQIQALTTTFMIKILFLDSEFLLGENVRLAKFKTTPNSFFSKMQFGAFQLMSV